MRECEVEQHCSCVSPLSVPPVYASQGRTSETRCTGGGEYATKTPPAVRLVNTGEWERGALDREFAASERSSVVWPCGLGASISFRRFTKETQQGLRFV